MRAWKWMAFTNPARTDGALFYHWRRLAEESKDYPFAKFNKVIATYCAIKMCSEHTILNAPWYAFQNTFRTLLNSTASI